MRRFVFHPLSSSVVPPNPKPDLGCTQIVRARYKGRHCRNTSAIIMEEGPDWQGDTASSAIASKPVSFDINEVGCYIHLFFIFYFMQKNFFLFLPLSPICVLFHGNVEETVLRSDSVNYLDTYFLLQERCFFGFGSHLPFTTTAPLCRTFGCLIKWRYHQWYSSHYHNGVGLSRFSGQSLSLRHEESATLFPVLLFSCAFVQPPPPTRCLAPPPLFFQCWKFAKFKLQYSFELTL